MLINFRESTIIPTKYFSVADYADRVTNLKSVKLMPDPLIESIFQFKKNVAVLKLYREVKAMIPLMNYETSFVGIINCEQVLSIGGFSYPSRLLLVESQQWKRQNHVWNIFRVSKKDTRTTLDFVLVCLLITVKKFFLLIWCLQCWLWTNKCRLGYVFAIAIDTTMVIVFLVEKCIFFILRWLSVSGTAK